MSKPVKIKTRVGLIPRLRGRHAKLLTLAARMERVFPNMTPEAQHEFLVAHPDLVKGIKRAKQAISRLRRAVEVFDA